MTRKAVKRQIKSTIIISSLLSLLCTSSFSQTHYPDTAAFKRDFEKLLSKYGINGKGYFLNVASVNQTGGQTAFVITNNYYGDSISAVSNFEYSISNDVLTVSPKKGIWASPFVATNVFKSNRFFFITGNLCTEMPGWGITIENKPHIPLKTIIQNSPCSKRIPIFIKLIKNDPNDFYVFGDIQDPNKTYLYYKGLVSWLPAKEH